MERLSIWHTQAWCAWCGETLKCKQRHFCGPRCANSYNADVYQERKFAKLDQEEGLP
jgi:hypothetical protein